MTRANDVLTQLAASVESLARQRISEMNLVDVAARVDHGTLAATDWSLETAITIALRVDAFDPDEFLALFAEALAHATAERGIPPLSPEPDPLTAHRDAMDKLLSTPPTVYTPPPPFAPVPPSPLTTSPPFVPVTSMPGWDEILFGSPTVTPPTLPGPGPVSVSTSAPEMTLPRGDSLADPDIDSILKGASHIEAHDHDTTPDSLVDVKVVYADGGSFTLQVPRESAARMFAAVSARAAAIPDIDAPLGYEPTR